MLVDVSYGGITEIMDMRTRRAQFSKGRIFSPRRIKGARVRGFTFYFVYFATLVTASRVAFSIPRNFHTREVSEK